MFHLGLKLFLPPATNQKVDPHCTQMHIQCTQGDIVLSCFHLQGSGSAQAKSDDNQPTSFTSPFPVHQFLLQSFRTVKQIKKDGNCLFRAVAFHTLGDEDNHDDIRTLLVRFENLNKALFENRFIPGGNATSFLDHLKRQLWPGVWGTQVELMATATLFQVPVYCCYTNLSGTKYHWEAIKPIATPANLRVPEIVEEDPVAKMHTPHHFELLCILGTHTHFDCIVSQPDDSLCTSFPVLSGTEHFMDLT